MDVEVRLYGNLSHLAGTRVTTVQVQGASPTVADLRLAIAEQLPVVAAHLQHAAVGSGVALLSEEAELQPGTPVSLLPPVSGG